MFKVVPDQLRISEGWVRCGHCNNVFDASTHMLPAHEQAALLAAPASKPVAAYASQGGSNATLDVSADGSPGRAASGAEATPPLPRTEPISWQTLARPEASVLEAPAPLDIPPPAWEEERLATGAEAGVMQSELWRRRATASAEPARAHDSEFDSTAHLPEPEPELEPERSHAGAPLPEEVVDPRFEPVFDLDAPQTAADALLSAQLAADDVSVPEPPPVPDAAPLIDEAPPTAEPTSEVEVLPAVGGADEAGDADDGAEELLPTAATEPGLPSAKAPPAPSFVAAAQRRAFWSSRPMRLGLWLALLVLLVGLLLQAVWSRRDWLAAREPRLAPMLQALCQPLGCELAPYRLLGAIVIDSSSFNRATAGSFRFSVTLRNQADMPVAAPALELTLTDLQDQPLVRRVLSAAELGAPPALAAHGEFNASHVIMVNPGAAATAITGYRLMAFYP